MESKHDRLVRRKATYDVEVGRIETFLDSIDFLESITKKRRCFFKHSLDLSSYLYICDPEIVAFRRLQDWLLTSSFWKS